MGEVLAASKIGLVTLLPTPSYVESLPIKLFEYMAAGMPVIASDFSRLVIDPNRGEEDPTLVMKLYDGTIIPGNRHVDAVEVERRLATLYRPYHDALSALAADVPTTS